MKILQCILFFLFLYPNSYCFSQGRFTLKPQKNKVKIPFIYHQNIIIIPVEVNGVSLNLILDTGTSKTVIFSLKNIEEIDFTNTQKILFRGLGDGLPIEGVLSKNNQMVIAHKIFGNNLDIYLVSQEKIDLSSKMGMTIHGIIGYDFFKDFLVNINYKKKRLTLFKHKTLIPSKLKRFKKFNLDFHQDKPFVNATVVDSAFGTKKVTLLIDTGNSDALWLFEDDNTLYKSPTPNYEDRLGTGLSGAINGTRTLVDSLTLGNFKLHQMTTAFLDSTQTQLAQYYIARNGSIGNKILDRFNIYFDYKNQKMWLKKTRRFNKNFNYNKSGIDISYAGQTLVRELISKTTENSSNMDSNKNQEIRIACDYEYHFKPIFDIMSIRKNSPAALAGLKPGDILHKINDIETVRMDYDTIMNYFYDHHNKSISIDVYRMGELLHFKFQLKDPFLPL